MLLPNGHAEEVERGRRRMKDDWKASRFTGVRGEKRFRHLCLWWADEDKYESSLSVFFFLPPDEAASCDFFFFKLYTPSTSSPSSFSLSHSPSISASQQPSQLQVIRLTTVPWHTKSDDKLIAPPWWKEQRKDGRWWALIRNFGKSIPLQPWALYENVLPLARFSLRFSPAHPPLVPSFKSRSRREDLLSRRKRKVVLPASLVFT